MKPLINRRKDFMSRLLNFNRLKDFNSGSECDIGSEKFWLKEVLTSLPIGLLPWLWPLL